MNISADKFRITFQEGQNCILKSKKVQDRITEYEFLFTWTEKNAAANDEFTVTWMDPCVATMYKWDAQCSLHRSPVSHWEDVFHSMISTNAPISCYFDGQGSNRYCWALSECKKLIRISNGYEDQLCCLNPYFTFGVAQFTARTETTIVLRIDERLLPIRKVVEDTAAWWKDTLHIEPIPVPDSAREPLYSFWYSHKQEITDEKVEAECRRAKEIGFDTCIVDDGWQTDMIGGGYARCGDWEPAKSKFPDMAAHVRRVHDIGMKYILWYSVPLIGWGSKNFAHFESMTLRPEQHLKASILDPRYKEVRDFLTEIFCRELKEWDLDGFKFDFIDTWCDIPQNAPYNEKMDIPALQDAVDVCMRSITEGLRAIKPDLMLEFRQSYIGPYMLRYGNMFRVGDCAGDFLRNRTTILDLRMMMPDQPVHSDMLMLPPTDAPENNALQIISCMFGVLQYSGMLSKLDDANITLSRFWLNFLKEHRALLQSQNIKAYEPHLLYTWAKATEGSKCAVGVYGMDTCVKPDAVDTIYIANGCMHDRVLFELTGKYRVRIFDCFGSEKFCGEREFDGISQLSVTAGGLIILNRI